MQFIITISYDLLCLASEEGVDQCWGRVGGGRVVLKGTFPLTILIVLITPDSDTIVFLFCDGTSFPNL